MKRMLLMLSALALVASAAMVSGQDYFKGFGSGITVGGTYLNPSGQINIRPNSGQHGFITIDADFDKEAGVAFMDEGSIVWWLYRDAVGFDVLKLSGASGDMLAFEHNGDVRLLGTASHDGILYGDSALAPKMTVTSLSTASDVTFSGAQLKGGLILRDCNGAGRADLVPTAANLLAAFPNAQVGQAHEFTIRNTSAGATTITVTTNNGVTLSGTMTIAQNNSKRFVAVFTSVTAAAEAYTLYSLGTVVH